MNEKLLLAHNRKVRHNGNIYRIIAFRLGNRIVADADPIFGHADKINLVKGRSTDAATIRNAVFLNLFV